MAHCPRCSMEMSEGSHFCPRCSTPPPASETQSTPAAEAAAAPALAPSGRLAQGELFLGRYRIEQLLGRGGMGLVYRAFDTHLRRPVALKTLRLELADSPEQFQRLGRRLATEARAGAGVQHPNIVVVHDAGEADGLSYIVMELVEGLPLSELLKRSGPLERRRALAIALQVARALGYAHQRRVLHRDIKPGNVMLCPGDVAKVTDFGLAKVLSDSAELSREGAVLGTPAYMAPEQLQGKGCDVRTDLYALGVLLYECIAGRRPFEAESLQALYHQILEAPVPPLQLPDAELVREYSRFFERALAKEPEQRFADAAAFVEELERLAVLERGGASEGPTPPPESARTTGPLHRPVRTGSKRRRGPAQVAVLGTLAAVAAAGMAARLWQGPVRIEPIGASRSADPGPTPGADPSTAADPARLPSRRAVALLGFRNLSGLEETAWLSTALSEMLGSELAASESLRTVPGENVLRMRRDLQLEPVDSYGRETLERIRLNLGADLLVLGSYLSLGEKGAGRIRLDLRVQDAVGGEVVASLRQEGSEEEIFELVSRSGTELRSRLGVEPVSTEALGAVRSTMPANAQARRLYVEGLEKLRLLEMPAARERLRKALDLEPGFAPGHAALAEAWSYSGYLHQALDAAKQALEFSSELPLQERLLIEGRYRQITREWDKAIECYRTLFQFYPDNLEYGLALAEVQWRAEKLEESMGTVQALRKLPAPLRDDPRIDLAEAKAAPEGERDREMALMLSARAKAQARGAHGIAAEARFGEIWLMAYIRGEKAEAAAALQELKAACAAAGDRECVARALWEMAGLFRSMRDLPRALQAWREVLPIYRELDKQRDVAETVLALAGLTFKQGDAGNPELLGPALGQLEEAMRISRQVGDQRGEAFAIQRMAHILHLHEQFDAALEKYEASVKLFLEIGGKDGIAGQRQSLDSIAQMLHFLRGDLRAAEAKYRESLALDATAEGADRNPWRLRLYSNVLVRQGRLGEADRLVEEALRAAEKLSAGPVFDETRYVARDIQCDVLSKRGELQAARQIREDAVRSYREANHSLGLAHALYELAKLERAGGNLAAAREQTGESLRLYGTHHPLFKLTNRHRRLFLTALLLDEGRAAEAEPQARAAVEEAHAKRILDVEAMAREMLARSLLAQGKTREAQQALEGAAELAKRSGDLGIRLEVAIASARVRAASGRAAEVEASCKALEAAIAEAHRAEFLAEELEGRLALGEVELRGGKAAAGRARLEALEQDARGRGFELIARHAATVTGTAPGAARGELRRPSGATGQR